MNSNLPPRPRVFSCPSPGSSNVVQASEAFAHMDAQDRRIAELEQLLTLARNHEQYQFETIKVKDIIINNALIELAAWRERALIAEREL